LGRNPSNRDIAVHASVEFGAVVTGDLLIRWWVPGMAYPGG